MTPRARWLTIALAVFFVLGAGAVFLVVKKNNGNGLYEISTQAACDLLTLEEAKSLLSDTAVKDEHASQESAKETYSFKITRCEYKTDGQNAYDMLRLSLEVRGAKTAAGAVENASQFPPNQTDDKQVPGYGDEALWDSLANNLSVLKDGNVYTVAIAKGLGGEAVPLADLQKAAAAAGLKN